MSSKATTALDQKLFADLQSTDEVLVNDYAADGVTVVGVVRVPIGDLLRRAADFGRIRILDINTTIADFTTAPEYTVWIARSGGFGALLSDGVALANAQMVINLSGSTLTIQSDGTPVPDSSTIRIWGSAVVTYDGSTVNCAETLIPMDSVTGLTAALNAKATTAQGAKADTALQPADVVDDLTTGGSAVPGSAQQLVILKGYIDAITALLASDDVSLDEMQEIVDYVKLNRSDLDALGISSIAGLQSALDLKANATDVYTRTAADAAFATAAQGLLADSALQPADDVDGLDNNLAFTEELETLLLKKRIEELELEIPLLERFKDALFVFTFEVVSRFGGRVVRVRRSSDDAELDCSAVQIIDGTLIDFVGSGNDGLVVRLYSANNNGRYLQQTDSAKQRKLVDAGSLVTEGGKPALQPNGNGYSFSTNVTTGGEFSIVSVSNMDSGSDVQILLGSTSNNPRLRYSTEGLEVVNSAGGEINFTNIDNAPTYHSNDGVRVLHSIYRDKDDSMHIEIAGKSSSAQTLSGSFSYNQAFLRGTVDDAFAGKIQFLGVWSKDYSGQGLEEAVARLFSEESKCIFMAGQSNMGGRDSDGTTSTSRANDATIYEYRLNEGSARRQTFADIYPNGGAIESFGPDVGLMRTLRTAGEEDVYCFRYAAGGHSVACFIPEVRRKLDPKDDLSSTTTDRSSLMISFFNSSARDMLLRYFRHTGETWFVWFNGAEDAKYNGTQGGYSQDLSGLVQQHTETLFKYIRAKVSGFNASSQIILIRSPDWNANTPGYKAYQDEVRAAQEAVAAADPLVTLISSDDPNGTTTDWFDSSHLSAATLEALGVDVASPILG